MSRPLGALSGQDLAWPGLADDPAHRSPVKVALSKAKYVLVHNMLGDGRKWVGKRRGASLLAAGARRRESKERSYSCTVETIRPMPKKKSESLTSRRMMMIKRRSASILNLRKFSLGLVISSVDPFSRDITRTQPSGENFGVAGRSDGRNL